MAENTLLISCTCGKKYQIPQSMAGKLRCDACGNVLVAQQPGLTNPAYTDPQTIKRRIALIVCGGLGFLMFFTPQFLLFVSVPKDSETDVAFGWSTWWGILGVVVLTCILIVSVLDIAIGGKIKIMRSIFKWCYLPAHGVVALTTFVGSILGIFAIGLGGIEIGVGGVGGNESFGVGTVRTFVKFLSEIHKHPDNYPSNFIDAHIYCVPLTAFIVLGACLVGAIVGIRVMREKI
jgi:hypothetical protein